MRRGLWFAAGAGAGIYAMTRARRLAEAFTADGLRDRWEAVTLGARMFRDEWPRRRPTRKPSCASGSVSRLMDYPSSRRPSESDDTATTT